MFPFSKVTKSAKSLHPTVELHNLYSEQGTVYWAAEESVTKNYLYNHFVQYSLLYYKAKIWWKRAYSGITIVVSL